MKIKNMITKLQCGLIGMMVACPAFAAGGEVDSNGLCALIGKMHSVFEILRTLAFVGAAFYIAGWAWDFISKGEAKMDEVKKKGIGLLVGFAVLFMIGIILSGILAAAGPNGSLGCASEIRAW